MSIEILALILGGFALVCGVISLVLHSRNVGAGNANKAVFFVNVEGDVTTEVHFDVWLSADARDCFQADAALDQSLEQE